MLLGEVAAPVLEPVVVPLSVLAACIVAFGLCYLADKFVRALFGTVSGAVGWIPWLGSKVTGSVHLIESRITNALGAAMAGIDRRIGRCFHEIALVFEWVGHEIAAGASTTYALAVALAGSAKAEALREAEQALRKLIGAIPASVPATVHEIVKPVRTEVTTVERVVYPRLKAVEHTVADTLAPEYAGLRERTKALEHDAIRAYEQARGLWKVVSVGAVTAAVAVALERLGLGWVKCRNVGKVGKAICGAPSSLIDSLLAALAAGLVAFGLVELAREEQTVIKELAAAVHELLEV